MLKIRIKKKISLLKPDQWHRHQYCTPRSVLRGVPESSFLDLKGSSQALSSLHLASQPSLPI